MHDIHWYAIFAAAPFWILVIGLISVLAIIAATFRGRKRSRGE